MNNSYQLPFSAAAPPPERHIYDEVESASTRPFETQCSSDGSDLVELKVTYTKSVKRRDVQNEKDTIFRALSQMFSNVSVVEVSDSQQLSQTSATLAVSKEAEETDVSQDLVVELEKVSMKQPPTPTKHPSSDTVSNKPFAVAPGESDKNRLFSKNMVKLFADVCDSLEDGRVDLTPLYEGLEYLLKRLQGQNSAIQDIGDVTVTDVLRIVGELQVTADPCFPDEVHKHLPQWLTKSWMVFRLIHKESNYCIKTFCSMCLQAYEVEMIGSHVYSNSLLTEVCGQSNKNVIWNALPKPPKTPTASKDCVWSLECKKCDKQTSLIEQSFIKNRYCKGYYDTHSKLAKEDAVLFHIYALRGLQVNVDLVEHFFFCCRRYVNNLLAFLNRAVQYRLALKENSKPHELSDYNKDEAASWILFCTKPAEECPELRMTEFPLLCQIDLSKVSKLPGRICLIYGQITNSCRVNTPGTKNHLCWAIPLVSDVSNVNHLRPHFPRIVDHINEWLNRKRGEYIAELRKKEEYIPPDLKLVVGYLKTCHCS